MKTLKDLRLWKDKSGDYAHSEEKLKKEAIKWVKEMDKAVWDEKDEGKLNQWQERIKPFEDFYDDEYNSFEEVKNWIKRFFNITESELKNEK